MYLEKIPWIKKLRLKYAGEISEALNVFAASVLVFRTLSALLFVSDQHTVNFSPPEDTSYTIDCFHIHVH